MNSRLPALALLILSIPIFSQAQSPGGTARENYVDRIADLRDHINSAQLELGKLEGARLDASNEFMRANAQTSTLLVMKRKCVPSTIRLRLNAA